MDHSAGKKNRAVEMVGACFLEKKTLSNTFPEFFEGRAHRAPVFLPGTTPSYSNAGFQIVAYALEGITGKNFEDILTNSILNPLNTNQTSLSTAPSTSLGITPGNSTASGWGTAYGEYPALSMYSNLRDIAVAGTSILSSSFLSSAETRR
jgi:CubicO group peptidase (beta-lactamase class C family)